jgi:hypothetical protein
MRGYSSIAVQLSFARLRAEQRRPHEARRVRVEGTRRAVERETVLVRELALQKAPWHRRVVKLALY